MWTAVLTYSCNNSSLYYTCKFQRLTAHFLEISCIQCLTRKPTKTDNFHLNPLLFKDIDVPKETWFWIQPEEEDKKDEEDKEDECTSSDLSVSSSTELIAQSELIFLETVCMYVYIHV